MKGRMMKTHSKAWLIPVIAVLLSGCGVFADEIDIAAAQAQFCSDVEEYVRAIDTYGGLFSDVNLTVGEVKGAGESLEPASDAVAASAEKFKQAVEADSTEGVKIEIVDPEIVEAARTAEDNFSKAVRGINDSTPIAEAGVAFTSAAYALQVAWVRVFADAGCFDDKDKAAAQEWVSDYVAALQSDLLAAGYYTGPIDGLFGPATIEAVERLQAANGLPVTGLPDPATQAALNAALGGIGSAQTGALQGILTTLGYYDGAIDGRWSAELEDALKRFQTDLGVPATGIVDAETLRAFEEALQAGGEPPVTTTTQPGAPTTLPPETTTTLDSTTTTGPPESTTTTTVPVDEPNIVDILAETGQFTQFLAAVEAAGWTETLAGPGPFTAFAPPDAAFADFEVPTDQAELEAFIAYHIVEEALTAYDLADLAEVTTAEGSIITVALQDGYVVLNGESTITISNVAASNGLVHVVYTVLTRPVR